MTEFSRLKGHEYDALANLYDVLWPRAEDIGFYQALAETSPGSVLELGTGTGRIACELASAGFGVTGIDLSPRMMAVAESRRLSLSPDARERVKLALADMSDFRLPGRFGLVIAPFSVLLELPGKDARIATYRCCRRHMTDGAILAFDNWFRGTGANAGWGKPRPRNVVTFVGEHDNPRDPVGVLHHFEAQDYLPDGGMQLTLFLDFVSSTGSVTRETRRVTRAYASPEQTLDELRAAGFERIELYGGFGRQPFLDPSLVERGRQVFLAWK